MMIFPAKPEWKIIALPHFLQQFQKETFRVINTGYSRPDVILATAQQF